MPDEGGEQAGDAEQAPGEDGEQPEDDSDAAETDPSLEENGDVPAVYGAMNEDGIMPLIVDPERIDGKGICQHTAEPEKYEDEYRTVVNITRTHHTFSVQKATGLRCPDCGYFFEYALGEAKWEEPQKHNFHSGYCEDCDYSCSHPVEERELEGEPEVYERKTWTDGKYHTIHEVTWQSYTCKICGDKDEYEVSDIEKGKEEHVPYEYGSSDYCSICGGDIYPAEDGGDETEHHWEYSYSNTDWDSYTADGDKCVSKGRTVTMHYYCTDEDCYEYKTEVASYDPDLTLVRSHGYLDGYCMQCGAAAPVEDCKHPNAYRSGEGFSRYDDDDLIIGETYKPTGYGTHTITVRNYVSYRCPDCGVFFRKVEVSSYLEPCDTYDAVYDEEKNEMHCSDCGGVLKTNVQCDHKLVVIEEDSYTDSDSTVKANNDGTHTTTTTYTTVITTTTSACELCGALKTETKESPADREPEVSTDRCYYNAETDRCSICGALNTCRHEKMSDPVESTETVGWRSLGKDGHEIITRTRVYSRCENSGCNFYNEYYVSGTTAVQGTEPHTWNNFGRCSKCHAINTCAHEHTRKSITRDVYDGFFDRVGYDIGTEDVAARDADTHTKKYAQFELEICSDCGQQLSAKFSKIVLDKEPHNFEQRTTGNGDIELKCTICGEPRPIKENCDHENAAKGTVVSTDPRYSEIDGDDVNHNVIECVTYRCPDCLRLVTIDSEVKTGKHNYGKDAVCDNCEHTCSHAHKKADPDSITPNETPKIEQIAGNDLEHQESAVSTLTWNACPDCGQKVTEEKLVPQNVKHTYPDDGSGVCSVCKYKCTHSGAVKGEPKDSDPVLTNQTETTHTYTVTTTVETGKCPTCGFKGGDDVTKKDTTDPHDWKNGACSVCGYKCEHSYGADETKTVWSKTYDAEKATDDTHTEIGTKTTSHTCTKCGNPEVISTETVYKTAEKHDYSKGDGVCAVCGRKCSHSEVEEKYEDSAKTTKEIAGDDAAHSVTTDRTTHYVCTHCGVETKPATTESIVDGREAHDYSKGDGVCAECGHKCSHSGERTKNEPTMSDVTYTQEGATDAGHTATYTETTTYSCEHCGVVDDSMTEVVPGMTKTLPHEFGGDDVCDDCGYKCQHSETYLSEGETLNLRYKTVDAKNHTVTYDICNVLRCTFCEMAMGDPEVVQADVTETLPHEFSGDKCVLCGYVKPAKKASKKTQTTEQAAVSDVPVFAPVAAGTTVHGVNVGDGSRMATALGKAIAGIQSEYGANVSITVRDADMILTDAEYKTLNTLPIQEQVMVVLSALGYSDEVANGLTELGIELSQAAQDLNGQIAQRLAGMSDAEKAEYQALIAKYFPTTEDANGKHTEIVLEIKLDGGYRLECYSFDLKDGAWRFSALAVADAND